MNPAFDKQSIIHVMQTFDTAACTKYLKSHRQEIADVGFDPDSFLKALQQLNHDKKILALSYLKLDLSDLNDAGQIEKFIFNVVTELANKYQGVTSTREWRLRIEEKENQSIAATLVKLLQHKLSVFDDYAACHSLLTRLRGVVSIPGVEGFHGTFTRHVRHNGTSDYLYPFRLAFANAMHSAVHSPSEMAEVWQCLNPKDGAKFNKAQEQFWKDKQKYQAARLFAATPEPSAPPPEYLDPPVVKKG